MNKLKMAAVQERLKLKRVQIDTWTTREKLCLASAVLRSGDQNWVSVSRTLRSFDELNRPPDWFSQKNCALQYSSLLEKVDTPKRKRGERGEVHVETPGESIVRKLTSERVEELKKSIERKRSLHRKLQDEISLVRSGQADDKLDDMLLEIEEEKKQKQREAEIHAQWLKEREEKLLEIKRAWKPPAGFTSSSTSSAATSSSATASSPHKQRDPESGNRQSSSQSEQSSEAESLVDSPLSEPLQVDVIGDESLEGQVETKPSSPVQESSPQLNSSIPPASSSTSTPTPTSPLLTSLLKSPSQAPSLQASSILHSAITAQRGSSPTITSLLNSSPGVPGSGTGAVSPSVSAGIKNLVTSAINNAGPEDHSEKPQQAVQSTASPSAGAPTLSMLLELPPSQPGKPLPEIPSIPPIVPSTPPKESASATPPPSPPASPQPQLDSTPNPPETLVPAPIVEEEKAAEVLLQPPEVSVSSETHDNQIETTKKVEIDSSQEFDDLGTKSEKTDAVTTTISEMTSVAMSHPETSSLVEENKLIVPQILSGNDDNEVSEELPIINNDSEVVKESIENKDNTTKAVEIESTADKKKDISKFVTDLPHKKCPEDVEVPEGSSSETITAEISHEKSAPCKAVEEVSTTDAVGKNVINEVSLVEATLETSEELLTSKEESLESQKKLSAEVTKTENLSVEEVENKAEIKDISEKKTEVKEGAIEEEKRQSTMPPESKLVDEPSVSEPTGMLRKDETILGSVADEEEIEEKSPVLENIQLTSESPISDSQLRRRGGSRGRKSRGRSLALYRMRQERKAKERIDKEKDQLYKTQECDSEGSVRESAITPISVLEDALEKDKTVLKRTKLIEDEISNLKSEWDEDGIEDGAEEDKKESGTSQKKAKGKKVDGEASGVDNEHKVIDVQSVEKAKIEGVVKVEEEMKEDVGKRTEKVTNIDEERNDSEIKTANEVEKTLIEAKDNGEKKSTEVKVEHEQLKKSHEKKREEEETTEIELFNPKKVSVERKGEEKKPLDKKVEGKGKQISGEKKMDEKERKKLKENKVERKERKADGEKKVEEELVIKEEVAKEDEKKVGKERRVEGKDRKSLLEKRIEVGDKKQVREKRSEEKEEKGSGERGMPEKGIKELDVKRVEGERKNSRERKSEEKEKKVTVERKVEDSKRKSVDEKKSEEAERSKSSEKEVVVSAKKSVSAYTPDKSKTAVVMVASSNAATEKLKRKVESVEEDDSGVCDKGHPSETKQVKQYEDVMNVRTGEPNKETNESERKAEEDTAVKRKVDRRKGVLSKRLDMEEGTSKGNLGNTSVDDKEKISEGDATPKSNIGRRRGGGSMSISSAPGTPLDQVPNSPASSGSVSEEERDYRAWKKAILLVWSRLATHKFASIFLRPITNDQAPGYHNVVFRPVDLYTIKKNVENGVIRTTAHFQRDVMLMFLNAIMYNSSDHDVHGMSVQMQQESLQHIQILLEASEAPKILRRETREGNKRSDSSSQMHLTATPSQDEATSAGVTSPATSTHTPAAENVPINTSEEEISESESQCSYNIRQQKVGDSGDLSEGGTVEMVITPTQYQKDIQDETSQKKKFKQEESLELNENNDVVGDEGSSAENSNTSDIEDEKMDITRSITEISNMPNKDVTKQDKDVKQPAVASLGMDQCPDTDLGDEQLSSSQYGDQEQYVDEMEKKQVRRLKRSINECLISSEDSSSIPDDGGDWENVMSIKGEKADDTESVSSSVYKRRRMQRKSTNSDPDSLVDAPNFPFSSNSASLEESDYQAWKKLVLLIWDQLADHEFATIFMTPVRTDEAPRYHSVVFRPMDLGTIRKNVEKGVVRTISHFQRDVMLMFANALMYNPSHHDVHQKTAQMQKECLQHLQVLVQESSEDPEIFRHEIRESNNKIRSTGLDDLTATTPKSDSSSSEDQLSYIPTSGESFAAALQTTNVDGMG